MSCLDVLVVNNSNKLNLLKKLVTMVLHASHDFNTICVKNKVANIYCRMKKHDNVNCNCVFFL